MGVAAVVIVVVVVVVVVGVVVVVRGGGEVFWVESGGEEGGGVVEHFVFEFDGFCFEEEFEGLLFLALGRGCISLMVPVLSFLKGEIGVAVRMDLPIDVAELVFSLSRLQSHGDVKGSAGGDGAADARHGDNGDVFDLDVGGGFGDEHEGFVEAEQEAFVSFDGAFDAVHIVVAGFG